MFWRKVKFDSRLEELNKLGDFIDIISSLGATIALRLIIYFLVLFHHQRARELALKHVVRYGCRLASTRLRENQRNEFMLWLGCFGCLLDPPLQYASLIGSQLLAVSKQRLTYIFHPFPLFSILTPCSATAHWKWNGSSG